jgi:YihY family inner membrane protein
VLETATSLVPGYSAEISSALTILMRERKVSGVLGAMGLAVFSAQLFSLTRTVMNVTFRVERRRGLIHGFLFDLFALAVVALLASVLCGALLLAFALGGAAARVIPPELLPALRWGRIVALPLVYAAVAEMLFFVYRTFPYTTVRTRAAAVSALAVAALWEAARLAFGAYLTTYGVYGRLYGSFGVLVATLVWIYYSAVIFVLGAELAALLSGSRDRALDTRPAPALPRPPGIPRPVTLLASFVVAAALLLAGQSNVPTRIRFLLWAWDDVPLGAVLLAAVALGGLLAGALFGIERARLHAELRALETRRASDAAAPVAAPPASVDPRRE